MLLLLQPMQRKVVIQNLSGCTIKLRFFKYYLYTKKLIPIPIQIFGVKINGNGHSWLQCVAVNHSVKFIPILRDGENAVCQVFLLQPKSSKVGGVSLIFVFFFFSLLELHFCIFFAAYFGFGVFINQSWICSSGSNTQ